MEWYYMVQGERQGPVSADAFQRLVDQGVISSQTPVWREGMTNWQPYAGGLPPSQLASVPADGVICAECGGSFSRSEVVSVAGGLYCARCKPLALQRLKEGQTVTPAAEEMRKKFLKHEASIKSVGVLYYLGGAILTLVGIFSFFATSQLDEGVPSVLVGVFLLVVGAIQLWTGAGLRRLKRSARLPTGIFSGFGLLGFPLGTLINGYILYLVFSEKGRTVFSDEYRDVIEQTPHIKYRTSIVVWILLLLVLLLIGGAIIAAFSRRG